MKIESRRPEDMRFALRRHARGGLTLLELTVAMGVLSLVLLGFVSMILTTFQGRESMRELGIARESAAAIHEQLKAQPSSGTQPLLQSLQSYLTTQYGPAQTVTAGTGTYSVTTVPVPGLSWVPWTPSGGTTSTLGKATITVDPSNDRLVGITITIDWKSVGRNSTYTMKSMYAEGFYP